MNGNKFTYVISLRFGIYNNLSNILEKFVGVIHIVSEKVLYILYFYYHVHKFAQYLFTYVPKYFFIFFPFLFLMTILILFLKSTFSKICIILHDIFSI